MKRHMLKKGTIYLLSVGLMQTSVMPAFAEETVVVESNSEIDSLLDSMSETSSAPEESTTLEVTTVPETSTTAEAVPTETQETLPSTAPEEATTQPQESESQNSQETSSSEVIESPATSEIQTTENIEESTQTSSVEDSTEEDSTEDTSAEKTSEEITEEESSEEESTEEVLGEGVEETYYSKAYLNADAQIYTSWKEDAAAFTSLPAGYSVYVTSVVLFNDEPVWARIMFDVNDYSSEGYVRIDSLQLDESGIMLLDTDESQSFPADYQSALNALHQAHPNWIFKPVYVGDSFSYAINQQMGTPARALVSMYYNEGYRSFLDRDYDFHTNTWKQWEPNWAGASEETVRYYMDPRNFLNENDIFMFESLSHESYQSQAAVEAALANCFMSNATVPGTDYTYSWLFCWVGEKYNINPVALASRVRQEQGSGNSAMISGTYAGYEGLYNYFNIQATGSTRDEILQNGLKEAQTGSTMMLPDGYNIRG